MKDAWYLIIFLVFGNIYVFLTPPPVESLISGLTQGTVMGLIFYVITKLLSRLFQKYISSN